MSADTLSALAGALLSLAAAYLPGFAAWFEQLDGVHKRLVMLLLLAAAALGVTLYQSYHTALPAGWLEVLQAFFAALTANQAAYLVSAASRPHGAR